jgi:hypothetical protein
MLMGEAQPAKALRQRPSRAEHIVRSENHSISAHFRQSCSVGRVAKVAALRLNAFESPEGRPGSPAAG